MRGLTLRSYQLLAIGLGTLIILSGCGYNKLQGLDEDVKAAWGEVQNQYQRRADLVPNLVATVKGAAQFEQQTLHDLCGRLFFPDLQRDVRHPVVADPTREIGRAHV